MIIQELRDYIAEINEEAIMFDDPSFDHSIVGLSEDGRVIYDYDLMVDEMSQDDNIDPEEAAEFIDYNTIRSIPYASSMTGSDYSPIILDSGSSCVIADILREYDLKKAKENAPFEELSISPEALGSEGA